jgi:hypothetical protein
MHHVVLKRIYRGVAQLVEHRSPKPGVAGSSPVSPAKVKGPPNVGLLLWQVDKNNETNESNKTDTASLYPQQNI